MKLIFCGTPEFAVPTLRAVHAAGHSIPLVVTQPDRPAGRGMVFIQPPIKITALELGLQITQPEKIRNNADFRAQLESIAPDIILVVAYGRIIPQWMLDLPPLGNINLHGSLLPKYRGAAPIQWAIASGERVTGNTTMRLDAGLDTGDILLQQTVPIPPQATALDMYPILAEAGAELMLQTLDGLAPNQGQATLKSTPQDNAAATLAPILTKEDGRIDFTRNAVEIINRARGFNPWPGAYTSLRGKKLSLTEMHASTESTDLPPATVIDAMSALRIACGQGTVLVCTALQLEGRKRMEAADFLRGSAIQPGEQLG